MSTEPISLAVWDVPIPAVAGGVFAFKVGATAERGTVEVRDAGGAMVASAPLGDTLWPGSSALRWTTLELRTPIAGEAMEYQVTLAGAANAVPTRFSVIAAAAPQHTLHVAITERDTGAPLDGVEIRVGPFRARTDRDGRAVVRVAEGEHTVALWRTAHIAEPVRLMIASDQSVALTMVHVPEEHPDARWVR